MPLPSSLTLLVLVLATVVTGVRILVDDSNPLWIYSGSWNAITPTTPCPACQIHIDADRALNRTWHDTAFINTVQLPFPGVSIEVYTICPPPLTASSGYERNYTFTLDGAPDGNFHGNYCTDAIFNYLVYARKNLTMGRHIFSLTNNEVESRANSSALLLDYAIYDDGIPVATPTQTSSAEASRSHHSFPLPAVIAPAAAAVLLLANICLFFYYRRHRRPVQAKRIDLTTDMPNTHTGRFASEFPRMQPSHFVASHAMSDGAPSSQTPSFTIPLLGSSSYSRLPTTSQPEGHNQRGWSEDSPYPVVPRPSRSQLGENTSNSPFDFRTGTEVAPEFQQPSDMDTMDREIPDWLPPAYQGHWPGSSASAIRDEKSAT